VVLVELLGDGIEAWSRTTEYASAGSGPADAMSRCE
jgi:hypothetical protein